MSVPSSFRSHLVLEPIVLAILLFSSAAKAQVENMPEEVQDLLAKIGPVWADDIPGNIERTYEAYAPLLARAPKDGLRVTRDVAYGPDPLQQLDLYQPEGRTGAPVVVFVHGGAYVRGARNTSDEVYANIGFYFARNGMLGVNAGYRLAPRAPWPAGAEDVGSVVAWLQTNAARFGGDGSQIYLIGHSAGATHVAGYAFDDSLQPASGPGIAGIVLMSGRYRIAPRPEDPNFENVRAYFGTDVDQYRRRSPIDHIAGAEDIPTFLVIAEWDNPGLDVLGAELFTALCERDRRCPRFTQLKGHNHLSMVYQFNTADEALGAEILRFIRGAAGSRRTSDP